MKLGHHAERIMGIQEIMEVFEEEKRDLTIKEIQECLLKKGRYISIVGLRRNLKRLKDRELKKVTGHKWRKI